MYLKVPTCNGHDATVEEVEQAVAEIAPDGKLTVDLGLNYPCVEFQAGTPYEEYKRVEFESKERGFVAY